MSETISASEEKSNPSSSNRSRTYDSLVARPGARFSKVPIINGPGKLLPFTLKIEGSIVLDLT